MLIRSVYAPNYNVKCTIRFSLRGFALTSLWTLVKTLANLTPLLLLAIVGATSILGFLSKWAYISELASHFRLACLYAAVALLAFFALRKAGKPAVVAGALVVLNALPIAPYFVKNGATVSKENIKTRITIIQMNLFGDRNQNHAAVLNRIREANADLVVLSEMTNHWALFLSQNLGEYKYVEPHGRGIGLFSKLPLSDTKLTYYGRLCRPALQTTCNTGSEQFRLFAVHPLIPTNHFADRNGQMAQVAADARSSSLPVIVSGDMNCSPWSHYFSRLLKDGKLHDTQIGFGLQPSWPVLFNMVPLIPIDHCLISDGLVALNRKTLANVGSDHLPVYIELGVVHSPRVSFKAVSTPKSNAL
jgi:endonuclease/exonuclease/phosphatase (EEP) superfamily protein YafD